jgi:hypothetical protein
MPSCRLKSVLVKTKLELIGFRSFSGPCAQRIMLSFFFSIINCMVHELICDETSDETDCIDNSHLAIQNDVQPMIDSKLPVENMTKELVESQKVEKSYTMAVLEEPGHSVELLR